MIGLGTERLIEPSESLIFDDFRKVFTLDDLVCRRRWEGPDVESGADLDQEPDVTEERASEGSSG